MSRKSWKQPGNLLKLESTRSPCCPFLRGSYHRPKQKCNWDLSRRSESKCFLVFLWSKTSHLLWLLVCFWPKMTKIGLSTPCHPKRSRIGDNIASINQVLHRALMISTVVIMMRFHHFFRLIIYVVWGLLQGAHASLSSCRVLADKTRPWPTLWEEQLKTQEEVISSCVWLTRPFRSEQLVAIGGWQDQSACLKRKEVEL